MSLHFATQNNHVTLIKQLLAFNVNLNSATFNERTALHIIIKVNNTEIVEILLNAETDATERINSDLNAF